MTIVFDTNIILDALLERRPFCDDAERLLVACVNEHVGCITANSLTDIFYVLSKAIGALSAKQAVRKLAELLEIITICEDCCIQALELPIDDFEDALVSICASKRGADYIVSRDKDFLSVMDIVPVVAPDSLLKQLS